MFSTGRLTFAMDRPSCSLEIWFERALIWTRGTLLAFYDVSNPRSLELYQIYPDLALQRGTPTHRNKGNPPQIMVKDLFRKKQSFLTITSDGHVTTIYVNGVRLGRDLGFGLSARDISGQLILANSPKRNNSWQGGLRGLAIYNRILSAAEVARHYKDWTQGQRFAGVNAEKPDVLYTFHEPTAKMIYDEGIAGINLRVPDRFVVVDHLLLESPWSEFYADPFYLKNCLINFAGFVPLGFSFCAFFRMVWQRRRPVLVAILGGASVSLVIEFIQSYLPTRFSGVTDIITNTLGTGLGAALYRYCSLWISRVTVPTHRMAFPGDNKSEQN